MSRRKKNLDAIAVKALGEIAELADYVTAKHVGAVRGTARRALAEIGDTNAQ